MHRSVGQRLGVVSLTAAWTLMPFQAASLAEEVTLQTADGKRVIGDVLTGTVNTLNIHRSDGGYDVIPRGEIVSIAIDVEGGEVLEGQFVDWQDGRFTLRVGDHTIDVRDGVIEELVVERPEPLSTGEGGAPAYFEVEEETDDAEAPLLPSEPIEHPTM